MAPFRNRDRSNRSGRGQIEHNVLEGLPINQYREVEVTVGANSADNKPADKDAWPELPMPKDSHMLPEHSQQLLRAARSGRVYKPPAPPEEDNEMKDEEEEHKEVQTGFTIKKYVKVARHLEVSEPEYLAKRRKGMPSPYVPNGIPQTAVRETKVKKVDAEGNATVYKVLVPEGQAVEGEVQPTDAAIEVAPAAAVPGTIVEGVGVVNDEGVVVANDILQQTPPKRRVPPPKKKRGGPGRGKKRVVFIEGAADQGTPSASAGGELPAISGIKAENGSVEPSDGDTPMGEAGGEDDEGSGEEGSEDDEHDGDHTSAPMTPATPSVPSVAPTSVPDLEAANLATLEAAAPTEPPAPVLEQSVPQDLMDITSVPQPLITEDAKLTKDPSSSPDLPLSAVSHSRQNSLSQLPTSTTEPEPMSLDPIESGNVREPAIVAPPVMEPIMPPIVQATMEQAIEAPLEQTVEPVMDAHPAPPTEPVVASIDPVTVPPVESVTDAVSAPVIEPIAEPVTETIAEPSGESVVQHVVEPIAEPMVNPLPEVTSAVELESTSIQATETAEVPAPSTEQASAPPSEPDLMGSLERHLEKND